MKKIFTLIFAITISYFAHGQVITGRLYDYNTYKPVKGVTLRQLPDTNKTYTSNDKGRFWINITSKGYDTLVISCEGYYDYIHVVNKRGKGLFQKIFLYPEETKLDSLCFYRYDNNIFINGIVIDKQKSRRIPGVSIIANNRKYSYTNTFGDYQVVIPNNTDSITFQSEIFKSETISVGGFKGKINKEILLERKTPDKWDTAWRKYKNRISISVNQLTNGAFGINYLRFIKPKHALGIKATRIFAGTQHKFGTSGSAYKGYKFSAVYRYYVMKKTRTGMFIQGKFTLSEINFNNLVYYKNRDDRIYEGIKKTVNPIGFSGGIGIYSFFPRSNRMCFNMYAGLRYLPLDIPEYHIVGTTGNIETKYYTSTDWWYIYGAGSIIDLKFSICFLF